MAAKKLPPLLEMAARHKRRHKRMSDDWPDDIREWIDDGIRAMLNKKAPPGVGWTAIRRTVNDELVSRGFAEATPNIFNDYCQTRIKELGLAKAVAR